MTQERMTWAAYAVAQALYVRYQAGDELEFEQEMDASLPEQLLLCQLDEVFQMFRARLNVIAETLPLQDFGHDGLAQLMASAHAALENSHQTFIRGYVLDEEPPG